MTNKFLRLPGLRLHKTIAAELRNPALRQQQPWLQDRPGSASSPREFIYSLGRTCINNGCSPWPFIRRYGIMFQRLGYFYTVALPDDLIQNVHDHWPILKEIPEQPVIRLQIIHSGQQVPLHIDTARSVSLIYPLLNHDQAATNFYKAKKKLPRGKVNPDDCQFQESLIINDHAVLLNVDQPHDVTYPKKSLTPTNPRLSLNLKWSHMNFDQVVSYFQSYAC